MRRSSTPPFPSARRVALLLLAFVLFAVAACQEAGSIPQAAPDGAGSAPAVLVTAGSSIPPPLTETPVPFTSPTPRSGAGDPPADGELTLSVDAAAPGHPISPLIYGWNWADEAAIRELRLPLNRWGGNAVTRYNWRLDVNNRASDWFFENIPNDLEDPSALPDGSSSDRFVLANITAGAESLLTVPLIGWTPAGREFACAFRMSVYGPQQSTDPYQPDCGDGLRPDGRPLTGNDPYDTSLPVDESFVQDWVRHLIERFGPAVEGGVRFYNLDNEPSLWSHTHRDVHPEPVSYDELRDLTYRYAAALKQVDPQAQTLGPVEWGWTAYYYSGLDAKDERWDDPPDRLAHGDLPLVAWYLGQMRRYEQEHGLRILDYLDLHYYPQAPGVALNGAGDPATQELRLRSTRSLWDPAYSDESWIGEPVQLIPRMRRWVQENYPGTKLAISEYNFGGLEHLNGALAQAEALGIFGREGLDLATLWAPPALQEPGAFAFRMYRNYDGLGAAFGDVSLPASTSDPERLSIFAGRRSADNALTLMIINKSGEDLDPRIELAGAPLSLQGEVYRYSAGNLGAIERPGEVQAGSSFSYRFPSQSITLLVLKETP